MTARRYLAGSATTSMAATGGALRSRQRRPPPADELGGRERRTTPDEHLILSSSPVAARELSPLRQREPVCAVLGRRSRHQRRMPRRLELSSSPVRSPID